MMNMKAPLSKALIIKINLVFLACFLIAYAGLLLRPSTSVYHENAASIVVCSSRECKVSSEIKMKAELKNPVVNDTRKMIKHELPSFLDTMEKGSNSKIGMVNMEDENTSDWSKHGHIIIPVEFEKVSDLFEWKDLFPPWIDEEEEVVVPKCPKIPMPIFDNYSNMDMIVAKLPCKYPEEGWGRDVFRVQVHLVVANLVVKRGKKGLNGKTKVVFLSKCRPMVELFRCDDLIKQEGDWWYYQLDVVRLEQKVSLPIGSCNLALPFWGKEMSEVYDVSNIKSIRKTPKREVAYATVVHSSEDYVCGALALAQSLLKTGTKHDLLLLLDISISEPKREALVKAGWKLRFIDRIRNPRAKNKTYNEYNYSKFRLWQLTDYDKIIFVDSDIIVLRNIDFLFYLPQLSATGNSRSIFNSGLMVIEPSNCTFDMFMQRTKDVISYNGGDQGFLNEVFVWWHRLPRRINFLKDFWTKKNGISLKDHWYGADPPILYTIHYLGLKPWMCYRDYDCNWNVLEYHEYANDNAHWRWWKFHDTMDENLQKYCGLSRLDIIRLEWMRNKAEKLGFKNEHWRINVTDPRRLV
ncbi:UDP-glucuronate:xylan alpha-glucuronosyltransferase 2-like isoform X2 [Nicotiana tomentosiformis]|uniref:UDP-glucuronate:xylan alpha-glucuronosyltransferase 2-like isoform X2 n=2 Tax=Nicotiana tomentosiformis TaxID=4098 RepID=UPI00388C7050